MSETTMNIAYLDDGEAELTLGIFTGISCRAQNAVRSVNGRLVKEMIPSLSIVQEPIRGRGTLARLSMMLARLEYRFLRF